MKSQGFTMIELSIVLVIIGLVLGGIFVGRDLIRIAEVRAQISQLEKLNLATTTFRIKYNCLPGDCGQAISLGLGNQNGNNNSKVDLIDVLNRGIDSPESQNFWVNLSLSNLIGGSYIAGDVAGINSPALVINGIGSPPLTNTKGGIWVMGEPNIFSTFPRGKHFWFLTGYPSNWGYASWGIYHASTAYALDSKMDDGLPATGIFRHGIKCNGIVCPTPDFTVCTCTILPPPSSDRCTLNGAYNVGDPSTSVINLCVPTIQTTF